MNTTAHRLIFLLPATALFAAEKIDLAKGREMHHCPILGSLSLLLSKSTIGKLSDPYEATRWFRKGGAS